MSVFQFDSFRTFPELIHGVSTSKYGNMAYKYQPDNPQEVRHNRKEFFKELGVNEQLVVGSQVVVAQISTT